MLYEVLRALILNKRDWILLSIFRHRGGWLGELWCTTPRVCDTRNAKIGVNSLISSISCTKQSNSFMHFLRTEKYVSRSFRTMQCSLMKCLPMACIQPHMGASVFLCFTKPLLINIQSVSVISSVYTLPGPPYSRSRLILTLLSLSYGTCSIVFRSGNYDSRACAFYVWPVSCRLWTRTKKQLRNFGLLRFITLIRQRYYDGNLNNRHREGILCSEL